MKKRLIKIGDFHFKDSIVYLNGLLKLIDWIGKNFPNSYLLQSGDLLDGVNLHYEKTIKRIVKLLQANFIETHVVSGNHEQSTIRGNILSLLELADRIKVYYQPEVVSFGSLNVLMLPFKRENMKKEYSNLKYENLFSCLAHCGSPRAKGLEYISTDEIVDLSYLNCKVFLGHLHEHQVISENEIILGVPQPTRNGEQGFERVMYTIDIDSGKTEAIELPKFFDIVTLDYQDPLPENKNNLYNVKNAPSRKAALDKFKDYHLRSSGIEILKVADQIDFATQKKSFESNLLDSFNKFSSTRRIDRRVKDKVTSILSRVEN